MDRIGCTAFGRHDPDEASPVSSNAPRRSQPLADQPAQWLGRPPPRHRDCPARPLLVKLLQASLAERGVTFTQIDYATSPDAAVADAVGALGGADALLLLVAYPEPAGTQVAERLARVVGESPSFVAFEGYDSVQVVAEALRIGGPDRPRLIEALSSLRVAGTRGTISFSPGSGAVLQWTWPPVQIAARRNPRRPQEISVLYQAGPDDD